MLKYRRPVCDVGILLSESHDRSRKVFIRVREYVPGRCDDETCRDLELGGDEPIEWIEQMLHTAVDEVLDFIKKEKLRRDAEELARTFLCSLDSSGE